MFTTLISSLLLPKHQIILQVSSNINHIHNMHTVITKIFVYMHHFTLTCVISIIYTPLVLDCAGAKIKVQISYLERGKIFSGS